MCNRWRESGVTHMNHLIYSTTKTVHHSDALPNFSKLVEPHLGVRVVDPDPKEKEAHEKYDSSKPTFITFCLYNKS